MKIYSYVNLLTEKNFSNCYLVTNDDTRETFIVDPCKITGTIINQIEKGPYRLAGVLVTHNHPGHIAGIATLRKLYDTVVYAADYEVAQQYTTVLRDEGVITVAGLDINYIAVPGHSPDSLVYKIGNVVFCGDIISAGHLGNTTSLFSRHTLIANLERKILTLSGSTILCPGHGPPTSVVAEKLFNRDLMENHLGNAT